MVGAGRQGKLVTRLHYGVVVGFAVVGWSCGYCVGDKCYGSWCIRLAHQLDKVLAGLIRPIRQGLNGRIAC